MDLAIFVDKEASTANDPTSCDLHVITGEGKQRKTPVAAKVTKKDKPRGSSFATSVSLCSDAEILAKTARETDLPSVFTETPLVVARL